MPPPLVVCVIRHGLAGPSVPDRARDDARPLTSRGRDQARRAGEALAGLDLLPSVVWTSPLRRALETATLAADAAGVAAAPAPTVTDALLPDVPPGRLLGELEGRRPADAAGNAPLVRWVVGHDPHLSAFVATCVEDLPTDTRVGKGDVLVLEAASGRAAAGGFRLVRHFPAADLEEKEGRPRRG
jgi:phosphohistidine phosphatase SixA